MAIVKEEICKCCGHKIRTHSHLLTKVLIIGLDKLYKIGGAGKLREMDLTPVQYDNFQKLQYFKLVNNEDGTYFITTLGVNFLKGLVKVPSVVYVRDGKIIYEGDCIGIDDVNIAVEDKDEWKRYLIPEYIYEKKPKQYNLF